MKACPICGRDVELIQKCLFMRKRSKFCCMECFRVSIRGSRIISDLNGWWVVTGKGERAHISEQDREFASTRSWFVDSGGYLSGKGSLRYHAALFGQLPIGMCVDHINRDKLDNRRENLRIVPLSVNTRNNGGHRTNTSGHRGVSRYRGAWCVYIDVNGKRRYIGRYQSLASAVTARKEAERNLWGLER